MWLIEQSTCSHRCCFPRCGGGRHKAASVVGWRPGSRSSLPVLCFSPLLSSAFHFSACPLRVPNNRHIPDRQKGSSLVGTSQDSPPLASTGRHGHPSAERPGIRSSAARLSSRKAGRLGRSGQQASLELSLEPQIVSPEVWQCWAWKWGPSAPRGHLECLCSSPSRSTSPRLPLTRGHCFLQ